MISTFNHKTCLWSIDIDCMVCTTAVNEYYNVFTSKESLLGLYFVWAVQQSCGLRNKTCGCGVRWLLMLGGLLMQGWEGMRRVLAFVEIGDAESSTWWWVLFASLPLCLSKLHCIVLCICVLYEQKLFIVCFMITGEYVMVNFGWVWWLTYTSVLESLIRCATFLNFAIFIPDN